MQLNQPTSTYKQKSKQTNRVDSSAISLGVARRKHLIELLHAPAHAQEGDRKVFMAEGLILGGLVKVLHLTCR